MIMALSREAIVEQLQKIAGPEQVITDEQVLKENSHDRYRKLQSVFGIYALPLPAAVVKLTDVEQVSEVLRFLNEYKINCVPRTGGSRDAVDFVFVQNQLRPSTRRFGNRGWAGNDR